ncbi:MAG: Hydantoinase/oxoprolinase [Chlamydiales bacterium]|nr:Hydantoinase/oxoprolinase [Chlamydiales bacterium]
MMNINELNQNQQKFRIGIDIGGTNTDAVLLKGRQIITTAKSTTSTDITSGIVAAIEKIFEQTDFAHSEVTSVMIGTTHFVNAVLQGKNLNPVLVVRLALPATTAVPPLADWPDELSTLVDQGNNVEIIGGGYEFDAREISPLDTEKLKELGTYAIANKIRAVAITGVFSHVNTSQEEEASKILLQQNPNFQISLSHKIGGLNLLPRENATILNAALSDESEKFFAGIKGAVREAKLSNASVFFSSNDGTLENPEHIFPVMTYGSGPSNSLRGAALLTKEPRAIVADIGGTSTDVGILENSFPLESGNEVIIGSDEEGFSCNFPCPLTNSVALGGGSKIIVDEKGNIKIGPESAGSRLSKEAIIFGGSTLTITDIAVAKGRLSLGNPERLKMIDQAIIEKADAIIHQKLATTIESMHSYLKVQESVPIILVGGGATLFNKEKVSELLGNKVKEVFIPVHANCANALGAAVAKVSGSYNGVFQYSKTDNSEGTPREKALLIAQEKATENAQEKGADVNTLILQEIEEIPINYVPGNQTRLRLKVVGDLHNNN